MSADVEQVATEVLRLVAGYEETVVALMEDGPVRLDRWLCDYWSLRRDQPAGGQDPAVALWLRYATGSDVDRRADRDVVERVAGADAYRIIREESWRCGIEDEPYLRLYKLRFAPAVLRVELTHRRRVVYSLHPCDDEVEVTAVRVFHPPWHVCRWGEPDDCPRRRELTERISARGVPTEDVVRGVYVPLDISDLVSLLRRVL